MMLTQIHIKLEDEARYRKYDEPFRLMEADYKARVLYRSLLTFGTLPNLGSMIRVYNNSLSIAIKDQILKGLNNANTSNLQT